MDAAAFEQALERLAREIVDKTSGFDGRLALVGVRTRGVPLSQRLAELIDASTGRRPDLGVLDITLYRDDLSAIAEQPILRSTELPFAMDDAWIVLVDDVLYSGRTVRAAITALVDFGRPRTIQLLVMVDRGWRELPIHADYAGTTLETTREQTVHVRVVEEDGRDEVVVSE
jgi:pyrimidine operon attenuation protein/uracil phosphoribosyltransferase